MPSGNELLRRWFEEIWNRGNIDAADELLAPKAILHETAVGSDGIQSVDEFKVMARTIRQALPDVHFDVDATLQDGDLAAARVTITGTHTGPGLGVAPTGRSVRITGMVMIRTSGGRTVEGWSSFDMLGLFDQLGVVKRPNLG